MKRVYYHLGYNEDWLKSFEIWDC